MTYHNPSIYAGSDPSMTDPDKISVALQEGNILIVQYKGKVLKLHLDDLFGPDDLPWPYTFNSHTWAKAFIQHVQERPELATDEGALIAWFANAMMVGYDRARLTNEEVELQAERECFLLATDILAEMDRIMRNRPSAIDVAGAWHHSSGIKGVHTTRLTRNKVHLNTGVSRSWAIIRQPSDLDSRPLKNEHPGIRRTIKYRGGID